MFKELDNKKSISQQVEEQLLHAIRNGHYKTGQKLPTEETLCEMFNVSRTSVREAIKKMSARGLVAVKRGSGAYVSEMSINNASEILNIFFELSSEESVIYQTIKTRLLIEPAIAAQAAKLRTATHLEILYKNMEVMKQCELTDLTREAELDNEFHRILLSVSNNSILELLFSPIFNLMPKFKEDVFAKGQGENLLADKKVMLNHHQNILIAIEKQDEQAAMLAMQNHILQTLDNYQKKNID